MERVSITKQDVFIIYDGACPLCCSYVHMIRLREAGIALKLVDARQELNKVSQYNIHAYNLNRGMLVIIGDCYYYGGDAMHVLSLISAPKKRLNKVFFYMFRSKIMSKALYPFLKFGRRILLYILRIEPIPQNYGNSSK